MITFILEEYEAEILKKSINLSLDAYKDEDSEENREECDTLEKIMKKL